MKSSSETSSGGATSGELVDELFPFDGFADLVGELDGDAIIDWRKEAVFSFIPSLLCLTALRRMTDYQIGLIRAQLPIMSEPHAYCIA